MISRLVIFVEQKKWLQSAQSPRGSCFLLGILHLGYRWIPSGKHTKSYWKWPFIVDLPIKTGGSFHSYVNVYQRVPPNHPENHPENHPLNSPIGNHSGHPSSPPIFWTVLLLLRQQLGVFLRGIAQDFLQILHAFLATIPLCHVVMISDEFHITSWSKNSAGKVGAAEQPPSQRVVGSECLCELSTPEGQGASFSVIGPMAVKTC